MRERCCFCYDGRDVFYPAAPGVVFRISFHSLAASELLEADVVGDHFEAATETTDVLGMLLGRTLNALSGAEEHPPRPATDAGSDDFADMLEAWAAWCEGRVEELDGADPDLAAAPDRRPAAA